ncbi:MAG: penicillin-binding protein activator [Geminicoccaceae bacterium]|nr:penicillin-binding protein activator [Geminicoccaceae bacterium]MCB9942530.1 penicillin-binding protein activator [Geminicoccaceae bacterium]
MSFRFPANVLPILPLFLLVTACAPSQRTAPPIQPQLTPPPSVASAEPARPVRTGPVTVALLLPLSGQTAALGQEMLNASMMAIFDVGETDMQVLPFDTGGTPEGATEAAHQAVERDVELVLGPLFGASTAAAAPIVREAGLSMISFSNDARVAGNGVYVLGFRPEEQVERVVAYARRQGLSRIAAIAPDDAYGARAIAAWRANVDPAESGSLYAFYPPDENEQARVIREFTRYDARKAALESQVSRLSGRSDAASRGELARLQQLDTLGDPPFDAIMIADHGSRLRSAAALLAYYDVTARNTRFLGTMLWQADPRLLMEPEFQGGWIANVAPRDDEIFSGRYERLYSAKPNALAGLAYDATALAAVVARTDRTFSADYLTDPAGFIGRAGIFRLDPDGLAEHGLAVLQVNQGTTTVLEDAPRSFNETQLTQ